MKKYTILVFLIASWLVLTIGCKKNYLEEPQMDVKFVVPSNFPIPKYLFKDNELTQFGFDLGHRLFFDNALSIDKSTNCGTCHQPFAAFANLDHSVSHGVNNCFGTRNAPPLFNLAWQEEFMWDGGVHHIELSGLNALTNPCEMGNSLDQIVKTLQSIPNYSLLFKKAFGTPEINSQRIFKALTQFTGMLISANSKYDKYIRKEAGGNFTAVEEQGYALFKKECASCHTEPLFTDGSFRSNGLDLNPKDDGRSIITFNDSDKGKFKVPSLRNIELTGPYMHDGRFGTLESVLNHYTSGVKNHANLDPLLRKEQLGLLLTNQEKAQIIAFLKTLTDYEFIKDKRFAEL